MNKHAKKKSTPSSTIALNRKARHEYSIEERFEAGLVLMGWEVKSLREGRVQLTDSYVMVRQGEVWLIGTHISALLSASTHVKSEPDRSRKLLLKRREIDRLTGLTKQKGYTLIPLALYWHAGRVKLEIGLAIGKKQHDKRQAERERTWAKDKQQIFKHKL